MPGFPGFPRVVEMRGVEPRLAKIEEDYRLLMLAQERLANNNISNAIPEADVIASIGISEDEINTAEDVEIEHGL